MLNAVSAGGFPDESPAASSADDDGRSGITLRLWADLSRIHPAPAVAAFADPREYAIFEMIRNSEALELLDPDQLQRLESLVVRLLPTAASK